MRVHDREGTNPRTICIPPDEIFNGDGGGVMRTIDMRRKFIEYESAENLYLLLEEARWLNSRVAVVIPALGTQ